MIESSAPRITAGDEVRVYYGAPGQDTSFVEGVVCRVDVTTTQGRGFLTDISRDVLLGREQSVKPGFQHYVLYEQMENCPEKVEVLAQAQGEPQDHREHGSEVKQEREAALETEPGLVVGDKHVAAGIGPGASVEADGSGVQAVRQDDQARANRIISLFGRRK